MDAPPVTQPAERWPECWSELDPGPCFLCDAGGVCNGECATDPEETLQLQVKQ